MSRTISVVPPRVVSGRPRRVVLWDIETSHNLVAKFNLSEEYVSHENIVRERFIISFAWKLLGDPQVYACSLLDLPKKNRRVGDDRFVCENLHAMLSNADVLVAHNGDKYDSKFATGRMIAHGLAPLPPISSIDTLKVARKRFLLNSNRLDYLGQYLGVGRKQATPRGLWLDVLNGDESALRQMVDYNKQDVLLLEQVYLKLQPYV